jgi:hypothetical protein
MQGAQKPSACKRPFCVGKKENRYFTLKGDAVEDLLTQTEESGESLCNVLIYDLFGLSDLQYRTIRKEFAAKEGEFGVYINNEIEGQFVIFVNVPGREAWYNDRRVQKSILAAGTVGLGAASLSYLKGKTVGQNEAGSRSVDDDVRSVAGDEEDRHNLNFFGLHENRSSEIVPQLRMLIKLAPDQSRMRIISGQAQSGMKGQGMTLNFIA